MARRRLLLIAWSAVVVLAAALLLISLPSPAIAVRSLGISNPTFDFNVVPGDTSKGELFVINDGSEPMKVLVYAADQKIDATGGVSYVVPKAGSLDPIGDPAAWIRIHVPQGTNAIGNVPYLQLDPGERVRVNFDFLVPTGAPPGDHQILIFFEMFDFPKTTTGTVSTVQGRLGSRVHVRVQGQVVEKFGVQPFEVRQFVIGDLMPFSFAVRNDGNLDKDTSAVLSVLDSSDNELQKSTVITETTVYANTMLERAGTMELTHAQFGIYKARLTVTYQKEGPQPGQTSSTDIFEDRTIYVVPLWALIALVVLAGLLVLWLLWRAAVRTARRRADREVKGSRRATQARPGPEKEASPLDERREPPARGDEPPPAGVGGAPQGPAGGAGPKTDTGALAGGESGDRSRGGPADDERPGGQGYEEGWD